ncbi:MAG: ABC transporter ATP-binding protein [Candidatus Bipolaricaulia bacterium]
MPGKRSAGAILEADGLSVGFDSKAGRTDVLSDLSFSMGQGTWTTCLGPSGCGKTTLLRVLVGLVEPDRGRIKVADGVANRSIAMAYLPQQDTLLPWRSAIRNAVLGSEISRRPHAEALAEARSLFARFGLSDAESRYPNQLSGGMRQRVAVIRTYLAHREILLLDEPLGALDPLTRTTLQGWLLDVWRELGKTVLLVTHDIEEALLLSDKVLVLSSRPARIRREIAPPLSRPRARTAPDFVKQKESLLQLLTEEAA